MPQPLVHSWAVQVKDDLRQIDVAVTFPRMSINSVGASAYVAIPQVGLVRISDHDGAASQPQINIIGCQSYLEVLGRVVEALNEATGSQWFVHRRAPLLRDHPPEVTVENTVHIADQKSRAEFWSDAIAASPFDGKRRNVKKLLKKAGIYYPPDDHS
jgi:hypothetical protein